MKFVWGVVEMFGLCDISCIILLFVIVKSFFSLCDSDIVKI